MREYLRHDAETGQLRMVFTDLWRGQHETTEFVVIGDDGSPVRRGQHFDGMTVGGDIPGEHYITDRLTGRRIYFKVAQTAVSETKTACRRMASKSGRAKCALCQAGY